MDLCIGGAEAIILAKDTSYDFILMDHMMPGMDGVEATRRIKNLPGRSDTPIIALAANAVSGMREFFLGHGLDDFIAKPIEPAKLEALLAKWVPKSKREKYIRSEIASAGLERFSGSEESYIQVIRAFVSHTPAVLERLKFSDDNALHDFAIAVHGIKGSSVGIGAEDLATVAWSLEKASKAGDMDTIKAKTPLFIKMAESLVQGLSSLLGVLEDPGEREKKAFPDHCLLWKLSDACRVYDLDAMEIVMKEIEQFVYEDATIVPWLRKQVDTLEYEVLLQKLEEVLGSSGRRGM